jgi:multimeric flavodoxin WrbA
MNKICFINGSPRGSNSGSKGLIDTVIEMLDKQKTEIYDICVAESLRHNTLEKDFAMLKEMNFIVFAFPLYIDAIPSNLLEYMYKFDEYIISHPHELDYTPPRIYAIINNGFIEGSQNVNALRIMAHYTARIGYIWRFGIGIGAGEFVKETMEVIPLKSKLKRNIYDALVKLTTELKSQDNCHQTNIMTNPSMPKFLFMTVANHHWTTEAKKSRKNLSKKVWTEA